MSSPARDMRTIAWLLAVAACGGDGGNTVVCQGCGLDNPTGSGSITCDVLAQTGCQPNEKCTWVVDATDPQYVGHIGCAPDGVAAAGEPCTYGAAGAAGYDTCVHGAVCSSYGQAGSAGVCKQICDQQGGPPTCDAAHACAVEPRLFSTGASAPPAAGVCETACDPLADNDFDGPGSALTRSGSACGSADVGCYGRPSEGAPPRTVFACLPDLHYGTPLVHRTECTTATGCAGPDGTVWINSCSQGYLPVLHESTAVTTIVCVAMCQPLDCYAGNCGSNHANRLGAPPHRCATPDALGSFGSDEECQYLWASERDGSGQWLRSAYSDAVGICVDHARYGWPSCDQVPLHGSGYDAVVLGCVSSQTAGLMP